MVHIPVLRGGVPYTSAERVTLVHYASGDPVAEMSLANSGMVRRDIMRMPDDTLEGLTIKELLAIARRAGELFMTAELPLGDGTQTIDDYYRQVSATTGMPLTYCRRNAEKIHRVFTDMDVILRGLTRGFDLSILDDGYGQHAGGTLSWFRTGRIFGAVLPSNSPGVHGLWIPAVALKAPVVLKPGSQEPWSPLRIIEAYAAAGVPRGAFGFYPTDHAGAGELLRSVDRSMLFGDARTTRPYLDDPAVEIHGPGNSKIVLGADAAARWADYVDVIASSITANGGRSCINCTAVFTPDHGRALADALADRLSAIRALPADDPAAEIAAFANSAGARGISEVIDAALHTDDAVDLTAEKRGSPRFVQLGRVGYLLPTIVWAGHNTSASCLREFPFPYTTVIECSVADIPEAIGPTLVVTALTDDAALRRALMHSSNVDRLNFGPIPTWQLSWDQPHEGNLFEHLYRQRAFQVEPAA